MQACDLQYYMCPREECLRCSVNKLKKMCPRQQVIIHVSSTLLTNTVKYDYKLS